MTTKHNIEMAIHRITSGRARITTRKLSISSVAEEAGISASTIHNRYPEMGMLIRTAMDKSMKDQRDAKHQELIRVKADNRELRNQIALLNRHVKQCPKCREIKTLSDFYKSCQYAHGLQWCCKACSNSNR